MEYGSTLGSKELQAMGKETKPAEEAILPFGTSLLALTIGPVKSLPMENIPELIVKKFAKSRRILRRCSTGMIEKLVDKTSPAQIVDFALSSQNVVLWW